MNGKIDIRPDHAKIVHDILEKFVPDNAVWVFGSRAKWLAKEYSDLDLCIIGDTPLTFITLGLLEEAFEDSDLPYKVDVVDWATTSPEFRKIIKRDKVIFKTEKNKKMDKSLKQGWIETTLGAVVNIKHGYAFSGQHITSEESDLILVTPGNFCIGGGFKSDKFKYYKGDYPQNYILKKDDIVVTMTDLSKEGDTLGYSAKIPRIKGKILLHNQRIGLLEFISNIANRDFIYWLMRTKEYQGFISRSATGISIRHTSPTRIKEYSFLRPSLDEQNVISKVLFSLDDKITINNQINKTLEEMAQAIFKSWFVDFDPVYAKKNVLENGGTSEQANLAAMAVISGKSDAELEELKIENPQAYNELLHTASLFPNDFEDSELGMIPSGWGIKGIDDVAKFLNGLALQKFRPKDDNHYLPVLKIAQLKKGSTDGAEKACVNIPKEYIIDNGDIIFSWSGSLCVDIWCGGKAALNQHLFKVTSNNYPKWFYYHYTKHHLKDFQKIASDKAVTMGHIKREHLTQALCAVPNKEILLCADKIIEKYLIQIINIREHSQTLSQIRDSLLPKLLSGEIDVGGVNNIKMS